MTYIDLRSDTLTQPTLEMREYMLRAEVGDDVYGEDPTVNRLQQKICELTGKEAALFVTSGTQANQIAINAHTRPGEEVIVERFSHIFNYEGGASGLLSGVQLHPIRGEYGVFDVDELPYLLRPTDHHYPQTRLIAIENTHNRWGGTIYPVEKIKEVSDFARANSLLMHLDGARLWNASVATGVSIAEYASCFDSVSLCFSKGLGAPVGSILAGSAEFIKRAHYYRKVYGGGMRQAGILAAGAIYALKNNVNRLAEDHRRARAIAEALNHMPGLVVDLQRTETNIILVDVALTGRSAAHVAMRLEENGVKASPMTSTVLRAVTHLHITDNDVDQVIEVVKKLIKRLER